MTDVAIHQRRIERERAARKEAERLLEEKSRELFLANEQLGCRAEQLRDQVAQIRTILDNSSDAILHYDGDGQVLMMNRAGSQMFSLDPRNDPPLNIAQLFHPEGDWKTILFREPESFESREASACVGLRGCKAFPVEVSVGVVRQQGRELYTAIVRDLTRRKALEVQLNHARKMESIGQLAAGIAHEINTPIQFIQNNLQFLGDSFSSLKSLYLQQREILRQCGENPAVRPMIDRFRDAEQREDLEFLFEEAPLALLQTKEGTERVATIVSAMKEFAAPGAAAKSVVDLNKLIQNLLLVVTTRWKDELRWQVDFDPATPQLCCIPGMINQALLNVMVNAGEAITEATPGRVGCISLRTQRMDDWVAITIQDDGPGIPPEIQHRVFDPFFTTKGVGKGAGQGLAYAYDVVVGKHVGVLELKSTLGVGTIVEMRLPLECQFNDQELGDVACPVVR